MSTLFVCRSKDEDDKSEALAYIQDSRLVLDGHATSSAQWGPRKTAMERPRAWWEKKVNAHELSYCDLIEVKPEAPAPKAKPPIKGPSIWERLVKPEI